MATVHLTRGMAALTGGVDAVVIDAPRVVEALRELVARYPALGGSLQGMAVAVDGEIYNDPDYVLLRPDSEVHLVPRIAGG